MAGSNINDWEDVEDWEDVPVDPKTNFPNPYKQGADKAFGVIGKVSKAIDPYTGAPVRRFVGGLQQGEGVVKSGKGALDQMFAGKVLPETPSGEDIVYKAETDSGVNPEFAKPASEIAGPLVSGALDLTNAIPSRIIGRPATKAVELGADAAGYLGKGVAKAGEKVADIGRKGVLKAGEKLTGGVLDYDKSLKATKNLSGFEQIFPGKGLKKTGEKLGEMRKDFADHVLPGSGENLEAFKAYLQENKGKSSKGQGAMKFQLKKLEAFPKNESGRIADSTLSKVDELVGNIDEPMYDKFGRRKDLGRIQTPIVNDSRAKVDDIFQLSPEGREFKDTKSKFEDLSTANAKGPNGLLSSGMRAGAFYRLFSGNPLSAGAEYIVSNYKNPSLYHKVVGASKLPGDALAGLTKAVNSGVPGDIANAFEQLAKDHPDIAEKLLRSTALATGRVNAGGGAENGEP